jgi:NAD(P)-dependent dehydrogenase (short-subunit alcohol dehydrogenase family)
MVNSNEPRTAPESLAGRHAVVTGGGRGIGAAIARELAGAGAVLTLVGRTARDLEAVRDSLPARAGHGVRVADVTDSAAVERAMREAADARGPVFALVNNAGAAESGAFLDTDEAAWRRMIDANLMGAVFCARSLLPGMIERRAGRIVNVASTAGLRGFRFVSAYVAAKHALVGLTRALALETARAGVTVNAVCPGYTNTALLADSVQRASARTGRGGDEIRAAYASSNPQNRILEPGEVASAVAWLCDPRQAGVTGQCIVVDGGSLS